MIDFDRAGRNLTALLILTFKKDGGDWKRYLDGSIEDVIRSFAAIILCTPFVALMIVISRRAAIAAPNYDSSIYTKAPASLIYAGDLLAWGLIWGASLLVLISIARGLKADAKAPQLIIAYNWAQLLGAALLFFPAIAFIATLNYEIMLMVQMVVLIINLIVLWRILRILLTIDTGSAIAIISGLVIIEMGVFTVINEVTIRTSQLLFEVNAG